MNLTPTLARLLALAIICGITPSGLAQNQTNRRLDTRFHELDTNNDGVVTPAELPYPRLFKAVDLDNDGKITLAEAQQATPIRSQSAAEKRAELQVEKNLPYTNDADNPLLQLDVYMPKNAQPDTQSDAKPRPIAIMIHGGGWAIGDKANRNAVHPKAEWFIEHGYIFASINYRLSPNVQHPVHTQDCAAAIAWIHAHADEFGGDPKRIVIIGHSAGAHLAALVATDPEYLRAHDLPRDTIKAVIVLDGAGYDIAATLERPRSRMLTGMYVGAFTDKPEVWKQASPITHVKADENGAAIPPFLLFHAGDRQESALRSQELALALHEADVQAVVSHQPEKSHKTINSDFGVEGDPVTLVVAEFLEAIFGKLTE